MGYRCQTLYERYSRPFLLFGTALATLFTIPAASAATPVHTTAGVKKAPLHTKPHKSLSSTPASAVHSAPPRHRRSGPLHSKDNEEINVSTRRVASRGAEVAVTRKVMDRFVEGTNTNR